MLLLCSCSACQHPSTAPWVPQPPGTGPLPQPWEAGHCQPQTKTPTPGSRDSRPPCLYARPGHHIKIRLYRFNFPWGPGLKSPPALFPQKKFF
jgi:hypothetical protein